jgi:AraC-like DNA-binding protein
MDALSHVFGSIRIDKTVYTRLEATAPWGIRVSRGEGPTVRFALVVRGSALLKFKNQQQTISLSGGDVFIMFNDEPHLVADHPGSKIVDWNEVTNLRTDNVIHYGGGGSLTTFVSGSFAMNTSEPTPIRSILQPFLHLRLDQNRTHTFRCVLDLLAAETARPGVASSCLISHLYEALSVYAIRAYASSSAAPQSGWLAAISDKHLSKAIHAMHSGIDKDWSVESLAREARMSRSAFALKFRTVLGHTPLEYLTRWRIYKARAMIRSNNSSLFEVATAVGYGSESSFGRVFKREIGLTPIEYKRACAVLPSST